MNDNKMKLLQDYIISNLYILSAVCDEREAQLIAGVLMEIGVDIADLDESRLDAVFHGAVYSLDGILGGKN